MPEITDPGWATADTRPMAVPANSLLLIENLLDITHFYPLHDGNIGDIENSRIPVDLEEGEQDGNRYAMTVRKVTNYKQPPYLVDWFHYDVVDRHHTHCMMSPGVTRVVMRNAPVGQLSARNDEREFPGTLDVNSVEKGYVLVHTHTPIDEKRHLWWALINVPAQHMSKGYPGKQTATHIAEMFPNVVDEDKFALEQQQRMFQYPDDGYQEVFLKPDLAIRRARVIFQDLMREQESPPRSVAAE